MYLGKKLSKFFTIMCKPFIIRVRGDFFMYRFKYYYKDGNIKLSEKSYNHTSEFDDEVRMVTKNDSFKTTIDERKDFHKYLEVVMKEYEKVFNNLYRIEIVNGVSEILGRFDNSEVLELAAVVYKGFLPSFYRIEIVDWTNEVIDYIDLADGK